MTLDIARIPESILKVFNRLRDLSLERFGGDITSKYWPPEMKGDFRQGIHPEWRSDIYSNTQNYSECKILFGSQDLCQKMVLILGDLGLTGHIVPPHVSDKELVCDGESLGRTVVRYWTVRFEVTQ